MLHPGSKDAGGEQCPLPTLLDLTVLELNVDGNTTKRSGCCSSGRMSWNWSSADGFNVNHLFFFFFVVIVCAVRKSSVKGHGRLLFGWVDLVFVFALFNGGSEETDGGRFGVLLNLSRSLYLYRPSS